MRTLSEQLQQLDELHRRGGLSDDEFSQAKARLLTEPPRGETGAAALNRLRRSRRDAWIGGVCAGLAELTGVVAWAWRLGFVLLLMFAGSGALIYLLLWLLVPLEDDAVPDKRAEVHAG
jgi:phage shock protein C